MRRLIASIAGALIFACLAGCSSGPLDWVRRNTIHAAYNTDPDKAVEEQARIIESWPTTTVVLKNKSAILSKVTLSYKFPAWVDPARNKVLMNNFQLEYDIAPQSEKSVEVPSSTAVKIKVLNHANRKSFRREINTGSALFSSIIDVTPPGAERIWRAEDKRVLITATNPARAVGTIVVQKLDSGKYAEDVSAYHGELTSTEVEKLRMEGAAPEERTVMPGTTATLYLTQGYYKISLRGGRSLHFRIQVANGRVFDENGKPISGHFSFYLAPGQPSVDARKLDVPHSR